MEPIVYLAAAAVLQIAYMLGVATYPNDSIGLHQLRHVGLPRAVGLFAVIWAVALGASAVVLRHRSTARPSWGRARTILFALLLAGACGWMFLSWSNHYINRDGLALFAKIPNDVADHGAHVTHDEMLELYVHSRLYFYANRLFGWSVGRCYQVASALSGAVFVFILVLMSGALAPRSRVTFVGLILSCGFVQLFFGDVENYTMVAVAILFYLAMADRYLEGSVRLWVPSACFSLALGFHLLSGWLLPSLVYLFSRPRSRNRLRETTLGAAALVLPMAALLLFFHFHGLPIQRLWESSHVGGMGGNYAREIAPLDLRYHWGMFNVMLLLCPIVVVAPTLLYFKRFGADPASRFLQFAASSMLVFTFVWRAQLGIMEDWNLFAPGFIPMAILVSRGLSRVDRSPLQIAATTAWILTASLHTYVWVLSNHFARPS